MCAGVAGRTKYRKFKARRTASRAAGAKFKGLSDLHNFAAANKLPQTLEALQNGKMCAEACMRV